MFNKSADPRHFFETDADQAKRSRRDAKSANKYGNPIPLQSKLLAAIADPSSASRVYVAESAGTVRRVNVDDGDAKVVFRGPAAPVTCVALGGPKSKTLFAGSWDKAIWSWDVDSRAPGRKYTGHTDFVKALVCTKLSGEDILISGGADKSILIWNVSTGTRLHTLQDTVKQMLAVRDLVVDPVQSNEDEIYLVSASSDPDIRRWKIRLDGWEQVHDIRPDVPTTERRTILEHETSVYKLLFDYAGDEVDLWTASGDGTAKCLSRLQNFVSDDTFTHGDHVRAVAVTDTWVITAGRDEDLKFWDRSTGLLYACLEGHYDEVTDLMVLRGPSAAEDRLCSVSIDGTVRTWALGKAAIEALKKEQEETSIQGHPSEVQDAVPESDMTADEEAELAALMEDD